MIVRQYRAEDWSSILRLINQLMSESPVYQNIKLDMDKLRLLAHAALEYKDWLVAVAEDHDRIIGFLGLFCEEHFFAKEKFCGDLAFYVEPEWRGTSAAPRLLRFGEGWAIGRGAREIRLGITTKINPDKAGSFYNKCGYLPLGLLYRKRLLGVVLPQRL